PDCRVDDRRDHLVVARARRESREQGVRGVLQSALDPRAGRIRTGLVDQVVDPACEAVQRVYRWTLPRREQPCGQEVGAAVFGVEIPAAQIALTQPLIVDTSRI